MRNLSKLAARVAALGLLLLVPVVLYFGLVGPYFAHVAQLRETLHQERLLLGRLAQIASQEAGLPELERRALAARKSPLFLSGASEALMTGNMQSRISELASAAGVRVRTTRALPPQNHDGLRLLGVQVQLAADIGRIQRILHSMEAATPMLFIKALHLAPSNSLADSAEEAILETRIDVFAAVAGGQS